MRSAAEVAAAYRRVLSNRSLRRVLAAFAIFNAQEYAIWIAVTLYAYAQGGATTAGIVVVAELVAAALLAPFGAVVGDRLRRDRALALGYGIQAATAALLAIAIWIAPPILVYAAAILSSCSVTLTRPVQNALIPELADTAGQLTAANSTANTVEGIGIFLGPMANSLLVAIGGPALVCAVFSILMLVAVLLVSRLGSVQPQPASWSENPEGILQGAADGARELGKDPSAAVLTVFGGSIFLVIGALDILYAVLAIDVLHIGEQGAGLLAASLGIGGLVGAAATAILVGKNRLATPIQLSAWVTGLATAAIALAAALGPAALLLFVTGAARSFFDVAARTLLQRTVRDEILVRMFGLQESLIMLGLAVGAAATPFLVAWFGDRGAFVAAGAVFILLGMVALPSLRTLDRRAELPDPERLALLSSIGIFEVLPQFTLELLARELAALSVPAGTTVISEGDKGDRFYLIASGQAAVSKGERLLATLGAGEYFGEIALLRDVPRTATVVAESDMDLFALERAEFLSAVTGSATSATALGGVVDQRLAEQSLEDE
jgi:MFS family permease